ncbi:MAG: hypothetical protein H7839_03115 [Magnetococcus sp. YQC-5]
MVTPGKTTRLTACMAVCWMLSIMGAWSLKAEPAIVEPVIVEHVLPKTVSAPFALKTDSAGRVWFTEKIGRKLIMFNPETNHYAIHDLPASWEGMGPSRLAVGPQDEVWFTVRRSAESEVTTHLLGRFNPGPATFESFPLPDGVTPEALTVDAKGEVWFLNPDGNELGLWHPDGQKLERYPLTMANGNPREIAVDGQGQVWFSLPNLNRIGKFDSLRKQFTEFEVPSPFANPGALAIEEPKGNPSEQSAVWFVELTGNRIARFTPRLGRIDEVDIPTAGGLPIAITVDSEGRVWFLEYRGNKVGVFDSKQATFREFDIPTFNTQPGDIALDRQRGRLWFSASGTETPQLGMLTLAAALSSPERPRQVSSAIMMGHSHDADLPQPGSTDSTGRGLHMQNPKAGENLSRQSLVILVVSFVVVLAIIRWVYLRMKTNKAST